MISIVVFLRVPRAFMFPFSLGYCGESKCGEPAELLLKPVFALLRIYYGESDPDYCTIEPYYICPSEFGIGTIYWCSECCFVYPADCCCCCCCCYSFKEFVSTDFEDCGTVGFAYISAELATDTNEAAVAVVFCNVRVF